MDSADLPGVLKDYMLPLTERLLENSWMRAFLNVEETLTFLPYLTTTCRDWQDVVHGLTEFTGLCVAIADFGEIKDRGFSHHTSWARKWNMALLFSLYEVALSLLSHLWSLRREFSKQLRCAPLVDLSAAELQCLYNILQDGLGREEIKAAAGAKLQPSRYKWVTPCHRAP